MRQAPGHRASPACRRCGSSSPSRSGRRRRPAACATSPTPAGACRSATLGKLRAIFPGAKPYPDVRADRGVPLHLPRPGRGRPPARLDRQGDPQRRDPRRAARTARRCEPGEEGELVHRGALVAMGYWNDPARTAERFKPAPGREAGITTTELAVWSGDLVKADEEGFLYFVGRNDEMIKTSGYRVSPTEIEEVVYGTGMVRDAVALGVEDPRLGQRIVLIVSAANGQLDPAALLAELRAAAAALHGPERRDRARPSCPARPTTSSTATCCARSWRRERRDCNPAPPRRLRRGRRHPARPARRAGRPDAVLRLRPAAADRADRAAARDAARGDRPQLRGQGQPDARGRPAPQRARRLARRGLGGRDARGARHADAGRSRELRRSGQDPGRADAGDRGGRDDRDGVRDRGPAGDDDRRPPRHPPARRRARQPGLPGQGLRDADGRRPAAVRRRRRAGPGAAARARADRPRLPRLPHLRRLAEPQRGDPLRGPAQDRRAGAAPGGGGIRSRSATSTSAAASASRTSRRTSRSTWRPSGRTSRACWPTRSARTFPTRAS